MTTSAKSRLRAVFYLDTPHRLAGAQRQLQLFLRWAREAGLEPYAIAPAGGICVDAFRADGVPVEILEAPKSMQQYERRLLKLSPAEKAVVWARDVLPHSRRVAKYAKQLGAPIVHFNTPRGILAAGWHIRRTGLKPVLHLRGSFGYIDGPFRFLSQYLADRILVNAEALLPELARPFRGRGIAIHDGVERPTRWTRATARAALREQHNIPLSESGLMILSLSSFVPFKGLHHLLDAVSLLPPPQPTLVLAGSTPDPKYRAFIETRIGELNLSKARALGYFSDPEALVAAADLLVLPTVDNVMFHYPGESPFLVRSNEGLPQAILEAMASGLPVVASRVAGTSEQVREGQTGYLVPQGDSHAMSRAIHSVLSDPELRSQMGRRALATAAQHFDARTQALRTLDLLEGVLS